MGKKSARFDRIMQVATVGASLAAAGISLWAAIAVGNLQAAAERESFLRDQRTAAFVDFTGDLLDFEDTYALGLALLDPTQTDPALSNAELQSVLDAKMVKDASVQVAHRHPGHEGCARRSSRCGQLLRHDAILDERRPQGLWR